MKWDSATYRMTERGRMIPIAVGVAIVGLLASVAAMLIDRQQFYHAWLVAFVYWFTLAAGGLFFTMLHHLVGATWSVVLRRLSEAVMSVLPFLIIAFLPIVFGLHDLYHWSDSEAVAHDELLQWKAPFLNPTFFYLRVVIYFAAWTLLTVLLNRVSRRQDGGHTPQMSSTIRKISAPGMILFALTITMASFDWLMSLDAHWYSTIFGAYVFSGAVVAFLSFMPLAAMYMRKRGVLAETITIEHYHDMGKLLFAFIVFWAYMAFSQYFLIWYGNIPEETIWFLHRWEGSWKSITLFLVFGHFIVPFFILITRGAKRNLGTLKIFTIWMLVMHWVDLYWVVMPGLHPDGIHFSWIDIAPMLLMGGAFVAVFWRFYSSRPPVPVGDPKLERSIKIIS